MRTNPAQNLRCIYVETLIRPLLLLRTVRAALIQVLLFHVEWWFIIAVYLIESHVLLRLTFST